MHLLKQYGCFQYCKDTNLKANHNQENLAKQGLKAVSNTAKILIWKQITTTYHKL